MALTMTRTRTQTTLTKLVTLLANLNGELVFLAALERRQGAAADARSGSVTRRLIKLRADRNAVLITLRQFDPELDVDAVGCAADWLKPFGRGRVAAKRYESGLTGE